MAHCLRDRKPERGQERFHRGGDISTVDSQLSQHMQETVSKREGKRDRQMSGRRRSRGRIWRTRVSGMQFLWPKENTLCSKRM